MTLTKGHKFKSSCVDDGIGPPISGSFGPDIELSKNTNEIFVLNDEHVV